MDTNQEKGVLGFSKVQVATAVALLFHIIGLVGIFFNKNFFIQASSLNLLLMFLLIMYTHKDKNRSFFIFLSLAVVIGIVVEIIGTRTGLLFGNYEYGTALGVSILKVPLIIGINWFIVIYCCGVSIHIILNKVVDKLTEITEKKKPIIKLLSVVIDGATLAVFFDWLMEPVAIKLGYWKWAGSGGIPFYNYVCWFGLSVLLLFVFHKLEFEKKNKFALHLLMIQVMFFLLLRIL